jgi:CubicO group peptidase (beta-lactamase class C family)
MKNTFTSNHLFSLVTMSIVAIWGVWVSWLHLTRPLGADHMEFLFLSALVPVYVILVPFYALRVRWSYISGMLVLLGLFAGVLKAATDHGLFFSFSAYNLTTILVLLSAGACFYFSLRSYLALPSVGWVKSALGIGCLLFVSSLAVWYVSTNEMGITNFYREQGIHGVQTRTGDIDPLDEKIEALMAEGDIPSLAAAVVLDDEIVWTKGYGEPDTLDMLHDIGSITKPFVATAVLQLYEQGMIDLDDDVSRYLPFNVRHPDYQNVPITPRMLLMNRSCLSHKMGLYDNFVMGSSLRQWSVENRGWEYQETFETLTYAEFMVGYLNPGGPYYQPENWTFCQPGTNYVYSTPGYDLLGYLVEGVSGQPLNEYMLENIFEPLRMTHTTGTPLDNPEKIATPYERFYGVLTKTNVEIPLTQRRLIGGGGLYSTAEDLANFLLAHMNQGRFGDLHLLQPETIAMMHRSKPTSGGDFMQAGYGYGWSIYQEKPWQMWDITFQPRGYQGHGGRYYGYSGTMGMVEADGGTYGLVLLTNTSIVGKFDWSWVFATQNNIQNLILDEAHRLYQESINQ